MTTEQTIARPSADDLNATLRNGGTVQVSTYLRSTLYKTKHAGMFEERSGSLYVQHGRSVVCLSHGSQLLVGITMRGAS